MRIHTRRQLGTNDQHPLIINHYSMCMYTIQMCVHVYVCMCVCACVQMETKTMEELKDMVHFPSFPLSSYPVIPSCRTFVNLCEPL
jgi:hypothetical protein